MKLIPLDAVLSIIDKFMYDANLEADIASTGECFDEKVADAEYQLCKCIKERINTLEIKGVDIENVSITEWNDYIKKIDGEPDTAYMLIKRNEYIELAKHFFELGLEAQKGEEV